LESALASEKNMSNLNQELEKEIKQMRENLAKQSNENEKLSADLLKLDTNYQGSLLSLEKSEAKIKDIESKGMLP
jgi:hypothetical protein